MASLATHPLGRLFVIASLAVGLGISSPLRAGSVFDGPAPPPQKGVNIASGPKAPAADEPIALLQMASDLSAVGHNSRDPLVLIVAARITKVLGGVEIDLKPTRKGAPQSTPKSGQRLSPDVMLVEARDFAKGEKITNLLIEETAAMGAATGKGKPRTHYDTVQGGATDVYNVVFSGGQLAEAGIAGDRSGDLDLLVYDENDHLVCRSTGSSDREYCQWWPRWTGPFRIEIQNLGTVANLYRLAMN
jgi:hypothetical protein